MAKMFFSLGFWMMIVLFIALGYAFGYALGADCPGSMNCVAGRSAIASSALQDKSRSLESDLGPGESASGSRCAPQATLRENGLSFRQFANLQAGDSTYAPGLSITITRHPDRVSVCPGPIEIPPRY
ncbi:MAG: hypothetical protein WCA22_03360 [Candidatus Binatus sp.]